MEVIELRKITKDVTIQARARLDGAVVEQYAENYKNNEPMPPIDLFSDAGETYILADGWHRMAALESLDREHVEANIHQGGRLEAMLFAAGANGAHGLQRTAEDKRRTVEMLLQEPQWAERSDAWVADAAKVSDHFVAKIRKLIAGSSARTRTDRRGRRQPASKKQPRPCKRCETIGVPSCPKCRTNFPRGFPKKSGAPKFEIKVFEGAFGTLVREIDVLGNAYDAKESPEAEALRKDLSTYRDKFTRWHKTLTEGKQ